MRVYKQKFLIVEGHAKAVEVLNRILDNGQRQIEFAPDAQTGMQRFIKTPPDLVLLSLGIETLDMIADIRRIDSDVKIAVFTEFEHKEFLFKAMTLGVNQFFTRPFDEATLVNGIDRLSREIEQRYQTEASLNRHRNILNAINTMAAQLLRSSGMIEGTMHEQMRRVKEAAEVSTIFIFENDQKSSLKLARKFFELNDNSDADAPALLPYAKFESYGWMDPLMEQGYINVVASEHDPKEVPFFYEHRVKVLLILPIYVGDEWWGVLGIGNNVARPFDMTDVNTLQTVTQIIGSALAAQQSFCQLEMRSEIFRHTVDGIIITDEHNRILHANSAMEEMSGYTLDEIRGKDPSVMSAGKHESAFYEGMWQKLQKDGYWEGEVKNRRADGGLYIAWLRISVIRRPNGSVKNYIGVLSDFTARHSNEQMYRHMATQDALTGLSNRLILDDRLMQSIIHSHRSARLLAVVFIDLDNFKPINDRYGHRVGDIILQRCADHFRSSVRDQDTICRYGGDEFVIILEGIGSEEACQKVVGKLTAITGEPTEIEGLDVQIQMSVGVSYYPMDAKTPKNLIEYADQAMYQAKRRGKNLVAFYGEAVAGPAQETQITS